MLPMPPTKSRCYKRSDGELKKYVSSASSLANACLSARDVGMLLRCDGVNVASSPMLFQCLRSLTKAVVRRSVPLKRYPTLEWLADTPGYANPTSASLLNSRKGTASACKTLRLRFGGGGSDGSFGSWISADNAVLLGKTAI
jgi:hypothetical protein